MLTRCLHITNPAAYVSERNSPGYDKMGQVRWLVTDIRGAFRRAWKLDKFITFDEMMIRYKGSYCPARQYMPKKPQKWGIKVWCLADSVSKYVFNFDIYCGAHSVVVATDVPDTPLVPPRLAHNVVL